MAVAAAHRRARVPQQWNGGAPYAEPPTQPWNGGYGGYRDGATGGGYGAYAGDGYGLAGAAGGYGMGVPPVMGQLTGGLMPHLTSFSAAQACF